MTKQDIIREGMSKQDYVQKYLEDILADAWRKGGHKQGIDVTEEADKARLHLTKWGVVIKDRHYGMGMDTRGGYNWKDTFFVIPLIKEETNGDNEVS